jgi:hypothetical protein
MDGRDKHGHDGEWLRTPSLAFRRQEQAPSCPHLLRASNPGYSLRAKEIVATRLPHCIRHGQAPIRLHSGEPQARHPLHRCDEQPQRRMHQHKEGTASAFTRRYNVHRLVISRSTLAPTPFGERIRSRAGRVPGRSAPSSPSILIGRTWRRRCGWVDAFRPVPSERTAQWMAVTSTAMTEKGCGLQPGLPPARTSL